MSINLKHRREAMDLEISDVALKARVSWHDVHDLEEYGPTTVDHSVVNAVLAVLAQENKRSIDLEEKMHLMRDDWATNAIAAARQQRNYDRVHALESGYRSRYF